MHSITPTTRSHTHRPWLTAMVFISAFLSLPTAQADITRGFAETYVGQNINMELSGRGQSIALQNELRLPTRTEIESVVVVAVAKNGNGSI
ncbi:MAG: hypothetical protein RBT63_04945, partial [Bdellovibrionales bacterium]|nr:hypothetical protein [Bdellovibrionales bacterium]